MIRILFYLPGETINDATEYYVNLVKNAFLDKDIEVLYYHENDFYIQPSDYVFVIRIKDFINVYRRKRNAKLIMWFQGVDPEEHLMRNKKSFKVLIKFYVFNLLEKITLKKSFFIFFVSEKMREHFKEKHRYSTANYLTIPCYNKTLMKQYFNSSIKPKTSFVYAGSLFSWQCFEQTVALYKEIESKNSSAFLTVLTKDKEEAEKQIKAANIKNYKVLYVQLKDLEKELSRHKYGLMLREDHIVNNVSTPTKMNTYLSVGLMPIYTNVIEAFNTHLDLNQYEIKTSLTEEIVQVAEEIIQHDNLIIEYDNYYKICQENFSNFYDDEYSIDKIKTELIERRIM